MMTSERTLILTKEKNYQEELLNLIKDDDNQPSYTFLNSSYIQENMTSFMHPISSAAMTGDFLVQRPIVYGKVKGDYFASINSMSEMWQVTVIVVGRFNFLKELGVQFQDLRVKLILLTTVDEWQRNQLTDMLPEDLFLYNVINKTGKAQADLPTELRLKLEEQNPFDLSSNQTQSSKSTILIEAPKEQRDALIPRNKVSLFQYLNNLEQSTRDLPDNMDAKVVIDREVLSAIINTLQYK